MSGNSFMNRWVGEGAFFVLNNLENTKRHGHIRIAFCDLIIVVLQKFIIEITFFFKVVECREKKPV